MPRTHSARRWPARRLSLWQIWNLIGLAFFLYLLISRRKKVGYLLGFIPYDFRAPTPRVLLERMWNPADRRLYAAPLRHRLDGQSLHGRAEAEAGPGALGHPRLHVRHSVLPTVPGARYPWCCSRGTSD
ncbi:MAG: hypothetical protein C4345_14980 [Chloroflexota bacterium]